MPTCPVCFLLAYSQKNSAPARILATFGSLDALNSYLKPGDVKEKKPILKVVCYDTSGEEAEEKGTKTYLIR